MSISPSALSRTAAWATAALSLCLGMHGALATEAPRYRVQAIPDIQGSTYGAATDVNDRGWVTGHMETANGNRGFLYANGRLQILGGLDGNGVYALALNNLGNVVGAASDADRASQPVLFRDGRAIDLRPGLGVSAGVGAGFGNAINTAGVIAGEYTNRGAFIHDGTHGQFLDLGDVRSGRGIDINDAGTVLVGAQLDVGWRSGVYRDGAVTWLPTLREGANVFGAALNNAGDVIGTEIVDGNWRTLLYSHGTVQAIESIYAGGQIGGLDINERGWIVGELGQPIGNGGFQGHAFLYQDGTVHNMNDLLAPATRADWHLIFATGINERGQVVGTGLFNGRAVAFLATPVPEPESIVLMMAGLGMVAFKVRAGWRKAT